MLKSEFDQLIKEHFDLTDATTRRYIVSLEDAGQEQLLAALSSALYDKIVSKVDDIDFGTIPMSRGDITKVDGFSGTEECITIIRRLVVEYKADPSIVDVVITAIDNVKDRKSVFIKGFSLNSELVMMLYNMMVLSIERSVSLMIATSIEYIKDPKSTSPTAALNKVAYQRTMDDLLFRQLINFNNMCKDKTFDKIIDAAMKNPVHEDATFMYGTQTAVDDCGNEPTPGVESDPVDQSALTPGNTVDLFGDDTADATPVAAPEGPSDAELTGDTETPAPNEFPEDVPAENEPPVNTSDDECGVCPSAGAGGVAPVNAPTAEEEDPYALADTQFSSDDVEDQTDYDNIPTVTPSDSVGSDDTAINEDEPEAPAPEADEEVPAIPANVNADPNVPQESPAEYEPEVEQEAGIDTAIEGIKKGANWLNEKLPMGVKVALSIAAVAALTYGAFKGIGYLMTHTFIPFLRNLVYMHYYTKMKISDYLAVQADLIEANANDLQYSTDTSMDDTQKDKVIKRQLKWVAKLRDWSNKFAIDNKAANNATMKNISEDEKEKKKIGKNQDDDYSIF